MLFKVPGTDGLVVAAANATGPGVSAELGFTFPRDWFVRGMLVVPRANAGALTVSGMVAALAVNVSDENQEQLVSDSRGTDFVTSTGGRALVGIDGAELNGLSFRPFALQRPVGGRSRWAFQVQNRASVTITLAGIFLFTEEMRP